MRFILIMYSDRRQKMALLSESPSNKQHFLRLIQQFIPHISLTYNNKGTAFFFSQHTLKFSLFVPFVPQTKTISITTQFNALRLTFAHSKTNRKKNCIVQTDWYALGGIYLSQANWIEAQQSNCQLQSPEWRRSSNSRKQIGPEIIFNLWITKFSNFLY